MDRVLAAVVQMASGPRRDANLERASELVREAATRGASLVVLPEVFAWRGARSDEAAHAEPIPGPSTDAMAELARTTGIHLLMGSILERSVGEPGGRCRSRRRRAAGAIGRRRALRHFSAPGRHRRRRRGLRP